MTHKAPPPVTTSKVISGSVPAGPWPVLVVKIHRTIQRDGLLTAEFEYVVVEQREVRRDDEVDTLSRRCLSPHDLRRSDFEACDLLYVDGKRFIHVKKISRRSNILSPFFKHGSNSRATIHPVSGAWSPSPAKAPQKMSFYQGTDKTWLRGLATVLICYSALASLLIWVGRFKWAPITPASLSSGLLEPDPLFHGGTGVRIP
jgi:hypothetical protein